MNKQKKYVPIFLCLALLTGMISFSFQRHKKFKNESVSLVFDKETPLYLDVDAVNKLLIQKKDSASPQLKDMLDLSKVENSIRDFPEIENAEVYHKINGQLEVHIQERTPILRVFGAEGYYFDRTGTHMPLSKKHSPNVPLFYGQVDSLQKRQLLYLLKEINKDDYLHDQVTEIEGQEGVFILGLRDFSTRFELGDLSRLKGKIKKLKTLCAYLKQEQMERKYKNINLNYQQQAVATE